jgi:hypothetical protein
LRTIRGARYHPAVSIWAVGITDWGRMWWIGLAAEKEGVDGGGET